MNTEIRQSKEVLQKERRKWIYAHGSDHLVGLFNSGFDCTKLYLQERADKELVSGFEFDWKCRYKWKSRTWPSDAALDLVEDIRYKLGLDIDGEHKIQEGLTVWLTHWPESCELDEPREGVVIQWRPEECQCFLVWDDVR